MPRGFFAEFCLFLLCRRLRFQTVFRIQDFLPQTDGLRRDLDEFVFRDEFDRLLKREYLRRNEAERFVSPGGTDGGEVLSSFSDGSLPNGPSASVSTAASVSAGVPAVSDRHETQNSKRSGASTPVMKVRIGNPPRWNHCIASIVPQTGNKVKVYSKKSP